MQPFAEILLSQLLRHCYQLPISSPPMSVQVFDEFSLYPKARLSEFSLPDSYQEFLVRTGLPTWCAPNIYFGERGDERQILPSLEKDGRCFLGLGEDRDENPIAIDLADYSVWDLSSDGPLRYVASEVISLSTALYQFQKCVNAAVEVDRRAFTRNRISAGSMAPFLSWAAIHDPKMLEPGAFWHCVLIQMNVPNDAFPAQLE